MIDREVPESIGAGYGAQGLDRPITLTTSRLAHGALTDEADEPTALCSRVFQSVLAALQDSGTRRRSIKVSLNHSAYRSMSHSSTDR